jgi:SAM-dependent methyltransferase
MSDVYDHPKYYEIAFSFRDIDKEVDLFEECFKRFSAIPVKSTLELGCGNSPHLEELVKRGYYYNGLDLNEKMLEYDRNKAKRIGAEVNLFRADMNDFTLPAPVDFVYIMLGSLCVKDNTEMENHFKCVARALKRGGLYLSDWCIQFDIPLTADDGSSWEFEHEGVTVHANVKWKVVSRTEQTFEEVITFDVNDHGTRHHIVGSEIKRAIYPQEFLGFIRHHPDFEFIGWYNNWNLGMPLDQANEISRPVVVVRRI